MPKRRSSIKVVRRDSIKVPYALAVYGEQEVNAALAVLRNPAGLSVGPITAKFERAIASTFGHRYGVMVNSGSSANLIALELLRLKPGSEVITPLLTFATTVAPMVQKGLVPVFVDVAPGTFVVDAKLVERAISRRTKAMLIPSLIGNVPDLPRLRRIARRHGLALIEDSCDTLGATIGGKPTGTYADVTTTSFYASHIVTGAGGGGMVCASDRVLAERALQLSRWGRASTLFGESESVSKRYKTKVGGHIYDGKYVFNEAGYNFQPLELQAAFGLAQLKRLRTVTARRAANVAFLRRSFQRFERYFELPVQRPDVRTNWLAFPLTVRLGAPFSRIEITSYLEGRGIQTRPVMTGNVMEQPGFRKIAHRYGPGGHPVTDHVMANGFMVGCHPGLTRAQLQYLVESVEKFLQRY